VWLPARKLTESDAPIFDYGAGIGTNVLYLMSQKIEAWYYELNHMQTSFFQYRMMKKRLKANVMFPMIEKPLIEFGTILLQDVFRAHPQLQADSDRVDSNAEEGREDNRGIPLCQKEV
jgi:hypothetical protein